jgi:eukaryotic-like serine/threonine-protein kinase
MTDRNDRLWERWDEIDRIFEAVLEHPPEARDRVLVEQCDGDATLLELVRKLLERSDPASAALAGPGQLLLRSIWDAPAPEEPERPALRPGERVGRYRVGDELGRGGMAIVYAAERDDGAFQQQVALKVLRRNLDTAELTDRFLREREILSRLAHPNIARLLDGGATDDGRPYLVMERVAGRPITGFADERRLPIRARLELLLQVTEAVQFAHRRLVVHRDLKPSNIFVDDEGHAKLLDFGIAKLLDSVDELESPVTRIGGGPHTPEYASPEQVRGEPVTTVSDVYQLGLLLYELLTGRRPYAGRGLQLETAITAGRVARPSEATAPGVANGAQTAATSDDPAPSPDEVAALRATTPDALRRELRGDLDTIVLKALRTEPDMRYGSVEAFAEDVRRHLDGRPIRATTPSAVYRLRKFARRNPWSAPFVGLLSLALAGYVTTLTVHARNLEVERNETQAHADRANELRSFLVDLFKVADPYATPDPSRNRQITVVEALEIGAERVRAELTDRPLLLAGILSAIGGVYANLDQRQAAESLLNEAIATRRLHDATRTVEHLDDLNHLAGVVGLGGNYDSAAALQRDRLVLERELHGLAHARVGTTHLSLSAHLASAARHEEALEHREEAVRILRAAGPDAASALSDALALIADTYSIFDRLDDSEAAAREAVLIASEVHGPAHPLTARHQVHLAQSLSKRERFDEAIAVYREVLPILDQALGPDHYITLTSRNNFAVTLEASGDFASAEAVHRSLMDIRRRTAGDRSREMADLLQNLAVAVRSRGRMSEADELVTTAYDIYRDVLPAGHYLIAFPLLSRTEIQLARGDDAGAERSGREAAAILEAGLPPGHFATAVANCRLGAALARQGRLAEAAPLLERSLDQLRASESAPGRFPAECAEHHAAHRQAVTAGAATQR